MDGYSYLEALRQERALEEIDNLQKLGGEFLGREAKIVLPFPVEMGTKTFTKVIVRSGVRKHFVEEWAEPLQNARQRVDDDKLDDKSVKSLISKIKIVTDGSSGVLTDGKHYQSDVFFVS